MKLHLIVTLLLSLACQKATPQTSYSIIWDRFWLDDNFSDVTVTFGDQFVFHCQVQDTEEAEDRYENLIALRNQQDFDRCNSTGERATFVDFCPADSIRITLQVVDSPPLDGQVVRFEAGEVYYFTSFSDGSLNGAQNRMSQEGGACSNNPPLKLTVSVAPTTSSVMATSTVLSSTVVTSTRSVSSTSMVATTATGTTATNPPTDNAQTPSPTPVSLIGAAGHLLPLHSIILLFAIAGLIF